MISINMSILYVLFILLPLSVNSQKLTSPTEAHLRSHHRLPILKTQTHHLPVLKSHTHNLPILRKTFRTLTTKPMSCGNFLAKALYGLNLCLQPKYGQVYFPFDPVHFPTLKSKPLLYYPMIIDRVINRKPIILPQTFKQVGKVFLYLTELKEYFKSKLHISSAAFALLPTGSKNITCEQPLLKYLRAFQTSRFNRKLKALASIFIPICIIKMLHKRQTAREEAMCRNSTEFIHMAKKVFYQTTRHYEHLYQRHYHHHHHHHHHPHHHHHHHYTNEEFSK